MYAPPPAKSFLISLAAVLALLAGEIAATTPVEAQGICGRTAAVQSAILAQISRTSDCAEVTDADLAAVVGSTVLGQTGILDLSGRSISSLQAGDFAGLTSLRRLWLYSNTLTTLPANVFAGLTSLQTLSLDNNSLTTLSADAFAELTSLEALSLQNNSLTTAGLPANVFDELTSLQDLNLWSNDLTTLPANVFAELTSLVVLRLPENSLTTLPANVFAGLDLLETLQLNNNSLTTLPTNVFAGLTSLVSLYLEDNSLTTLPANAFAGLTSLEWLGLERNRLTTLPAGVFAGLTSLQTLGLSGNSLTTLPANAFAGLTSLQSLGLNNNSLATLPADVFAGLTSLQWLGLSNNSLTTLPANVFAGLTSLQGLWLGNTSLTTLRADAFDGLTSLQTLDLSRNSLTTLPANAFAGLTSLQDLRLSNNSLTTLPPNAFAGLTSLDTLYLYSNRSLTTLQPGLFTGLSAAQQQTFGIPGAPQNISGMLANAGGELAVSWTAPAYTGDGGISGYQVRWKLPSAATFAADDSKDISGAATLSYTIPDLADDANYYVQVAAISRYAFPANVSSSSDKTAAAIPVGSDWASAGLSVPTSPQNVRLQQSVDRGLEVTWGAPASDGGAPVLSYTLRWRKTGVAAFNSPTTPVNTTTYTLSSLDAGAIYDVQIAAVNSVGMGGFAAAKGIPATTPGMPQNVSTFPLDGGLEVTWGAPASDGFAGITGYELQWRMVAEPAAEYTAADPAPTADATAYTIAGLTNGTTYEVQVAAKNAAGTGDYSDVVQATPRTVTVPGAPQNVMATPGDMQLAVTWEAPDSDGGSAVTSYTLRWKTTVAGEFDDAASVDAADDTRYTITDLTNGTTYAVEVAAVNAAGEGNSVAVQIATYTVVDICARTTEVETAILAKINDAKDPDITCSQVTTAHLAGVTGTLDLRSKSITALQAGDFAGLTSLQTLQLDSNDLGTLPEGVFAGLTSLQTLELGSNSLTTLPADVFDGLTSLQSLQLSSNSLSTLPANVFAELTSLRELSLNSNDLTSLPANVFDELTSLVTLRLGGNPLTSLPANVFDELTSLVWLSLNSNSLTELPANVFAGMTYLRELELQDNSLTELPANVFAGLISLTWLNLGNNGLTTLPANAFAGMDSLQTLELNDNSLTTWPADAFAGLISLTWLNLGNNDLTTLPANAFAGLDSLQRLELNDNSLTTLPANAFAGLTSLETLLLWSNDLTSLPANVFAGLTSLQVLWLDDNSLTTLPEDVFAGLTSLQELYLHRNSLTTLSADAFAGLTSLERLDLDSNSLTTLPEGVFAGLTSLETLYLDDNSLTTLQPGLFTGLSAAQQQTFGIPGAPRNISGISPANTDGELAVSWTAPTYTGDGGISGYQVRWKLPSAATFAADDSKDISGAATLSYTIPDLADGANYYVQVAAISRYAFPANASRSSFKTNAIPVGSDWASAGLSVPTSPQNVRLQQSVDRGLEVTWGAPASDGGMPVLSYTLRWRKTGVVAFNSPTTPVNTTTYTLSSLDAGAMYDVQIAAVNSVGMGGFAAAKGIPATTPGMPQNVSTFPLDGGLEVTWGAPASDGFAGITGYELQWRMVAEPEAEYTAVDPAPTADATAYTIAGLTNGTTYEVQVAAKNAAGTGDYSDVVQATPRTVTVPGAPQNVMATPGDMQLAVTWEAPDSDGGSAVTSYTLRWKTTVAGEFDDAASVDAADGTRYTITDLTNGTTYTVEVAAVNAAGEGNSVAVQIAAYTVAHICARTEEVRDAILAAINDAKDPDITCSEVTMADLAAVSGTLDLLGQSISALLPGDFAGLTSLQTLRLDNNSLTTLPADVFAELTSLQTLRLSNNDLTTLRVDEFDELTSLTRLDLGDNSLETLPANAFAELDSLETLYLHSNALTTEGLPANVFAGLTSLRTLWLYNNSLTTLPANVFAGLTSLETLDLNYNDLTTLPANAFAELDSLETLYLYNNSLTTLPADVFDGLTSLQSLDLSSNSLATLPADVFAGLTSLQTLELGSNSLPLSANAFAGLDSLRTLNLYDNSLSTLPADAFAGLTSLRTLWLGNNSLTTLPEDVFAGLTSLETLELWGNSLTTLPPGLFASVTLENQQAMGIPGAPQNISGILPADAMGEVAVSWAAPAYTGDGGISGYQVRWKLPSAASFEAGGSTDISDAATLSHTIPNLTVGEVYDVQVAALSDYAFPKNAFLPNLKTDAIPVGGDWLDAPPATTPVAAQATFCDRTSQVETAILAKINDAKDPDITCSQVTTADLAGVTGTLRIHNKSIPTLQAGDFAGLTSLEWLDLINISLTTLPADVFAELTSLQTLDLRSNPSLTTLPADVFDGLTSLQTLLLDSNDLGTLPEDVFAGLTSLQTLELGSNSLTTLPADVFDGLTSLQSLQLSSNSLATLPADVFAGLTSLETLYLSNLSLTTLPADVFAGLTSLQTLLLDNNSLTTLQPGLFTGLSVTQQRSFGIPGAPQNISGILPANAGGTLTVKWTAPGYTGGGGGISGYQVRWKLPSATSFEAGDLNSASSTTHTITGLTAGEVYNVQVAALSNYAFPANAVDPSQKTNPIPVGGNWADALLVPTPVAAQTSGICDRTPQVETAILAQISRTSACAEVTDADLAAVVGSTVFNVPGVLDLSGRSISSLQAGDFAGLTSLPNLWLHNNSLTTLPEGVFAGLASLQSLDLSFNSLTLSANAFAGLTSLETLSLNGNRLTTLPANAFAGLTSLRTLWLYNNSLTTLPEGVFAGLTSLQSLWLYNNSLATLPANAFAGLTSLETLYLYSNSLTTLQQPGLFTGLSAAQQQTFGIPGAPQNIPHILPVDAGGELAVSWTAPTYAGDGGISGYQVRWKLSSVTGFEAGGSADISGATTFSHTIPALTVGATYDVQVAALSEYAFPKNGGSNKTAAIPVGSDWADAPLATTPDAPANVTLTPGNAQIEVAWVAPTDTGGVDITGYMVRRRQADSTNAGDYITHTTAAGTTAYTIENLVNGTEYDVEVAAVTAAGTGTYSDAMQATPRTVPGAPQNVAASVGNTKLVVTWGAPADDGGAAVTTYTLRWKEADAAGFADTDTATTAVTRYTIAALTNGTTYAVQVAAQNIAGVGEWSASAQATPYLFDLNVDGNAGATAADGIMVARYLLGVTSGEGLVAGQMDSTDADAITAVADKLADGKAGMALDVDGDGGVNGDDGVLIARYLLGLRGTELLGGDAGDADAIGDRIEALMP